MTAHDTRFAPGTFTPAPGRAPIGRILIAQTRLETLLVLRHGEQALLNLIIPLALLVGLSRFDPTGANDVQRVFPLIMALAAMSAGFTGQAIGVAFDRRYGALRRLGASALPRWGIIAGKCGSVVAVMVLETVIFGAVALALGWRAPLAGALMAAVVLFLGVACFTTMGLLLGGTLPSHVVLALANILWFLLLAAAMVTGFGSDLPDAAQAVLGLLPSVALTEGLSTALAGSVPWTQLLVLLAWAGVCGTAAARLFSFQAADR